MGHTMFNKLVHRYSAPASIYWPEIRIMYGQFGCTCLAQAYHLPIIYSQRLCDAIEVQELISILYGFEKEIISTS